MKILRRLILLLYKLARSRRHPKSTPLTLVDIGASYFMHKPWIPMIMARGAKLLAVDPNLDNLAYLDNLKDLDIEKSGVALASDNGSRVLHVTNVDSGSSIFPPNPSEEDLLRSPYLAEYLFPCKQVTIQTETLDSLLTDRAGFFALKIDTQGAELEILRGAGEILKKHKVLAVETEVSLLVKPIMAGSCKLAELFDFLEERGFELIWIRPTKRVHGNFRNQTRQSEADALFLLTKEKVLSQGLEGMEAYEAILRAYGLDEELGVFRSLISAKC